MGITLTLFSFVKILYFSSNIFPIKILIYNNHYFIFANQGGNSFIIKLNSFKTTLWTRMLSNVSLSDAVILQDTIILFSNYPYFSIIKLDLDGNFISSKTYNIYNAYNYKFLARWFGNYYLLGENNIFKIDTSGKISWMKLYSNVSSCLGFGKPYILYLLCRYNFNAMVVMKVDTNGNVLTSRKFGIYNALYPMGMFQINDKFYTFAQYNDVSNKNYLFVSAVDTGLNNIIWSKVVKPSNNMSIQTSVIEEVNNRFIISGMDQSLLNVIYFSIDTISNILFQKRTNDISLEQHPRLYDSSIIFLKQDSIALFEINLNDGSSCYNDTSINLSAYNIYTNPFSDIQVNVTDVSIPDTIPYNITYSTFSVIENLYCKVSVDEGYGQLSNNLKIYNLSGRYMGCNLKHLKSKEIYIMDDGRKRKKIMKF